MSTQRRIYLDHNATSPLHPAAVAAMAEALAEAASAGNPSSIHAEGRAARDRVERARGAVATLAGRPREQIVFTSGGTEANALGVAALAAEVERRGGPRVVATSRLEHPSLRGAVAGLAARGWEVRDLDTLAASPDVGLVAFAAVNHELGTIEPTLGVIEALGGRGVRVHVDAVQLAGKRPLAGIHADTMAISAHKLGGPQGIGALVMGAAVDAPSAHEAPTEGAGHQERGRRPGTENVLGIVGFGAAAAACRPAEWAAVAALGDRLEAGLLAMPGARIHGAGRERIGGTVNVGFAGALGESIVVALDLAGVAASTGAACTSGSVQPSPVLLALGFTPGEAREAVRFSLGLTTTADEIDAVLALLPPIVERARRHR